MKKFGIILAFLMLKIIPLIYGQTIGDYGAISTGSWTTTSIWRQWDGTGWNTVPASFPNASTANVWILTGNTVTVGGTGPYNVGSLRVQTGGKLFTNNTATNIYLNVWGANIVCDGQIGNGGTFDGIAFNIEGTNCAITGVGNFVASRIRKSGTNNPLTTLVIGMDVLLNWSASSSTAIYNNVATAGINTRFDVTVNPGSTLTAGTAASPANVSVDGVTGVGGAGSYDASGTYTINGTLIVTGILYATTDNTVAGDSVYFNVGNGGLIKANQINSPISGVGKMSFNVQSNGKLELTGPNGFNIATWSTTNNRYSFLPGSTVEYSANANQSVLARSNFNSATVPNYDYWNLIISGSGTKTILTTAILMVRGNLTINSPAILDQNTNSPDIAIGGNWTNWNQSGFVQSLNLSKKVYFQGNGTTIGSTPIQTISCTGGEIFTNLWIAKSVNASVKLLSPITVNNILQLGVGNSSNYGKLELNGNSLTLENSSPTAITLIGTGSYNRFIVAEDTSSNSMVRWKIGTNSTATPNVGAIAIGAQNLWPWPYVIPFGINSNTDTIPFGFYKTSANDIGYLSVTTYGTAGDNLPWPSNLNATVTNLNAFITANNLPDNRDWTVDRFWYIGATNPVAGCGVAFLYTFGYRSPINEYPLLDNNPFNMHSQYWDNTRSTWALPQQGIGVGPFQFLPAQVPSAVIDTSINVWNTFWTLSSSSSPLPVDLLNFQGNYEGGKINLKWSTASEQNNDHFDIYRSFDGVNYILIGTVEGNGTTNYIINYDYFDFVNFNGIVYYKLLQFDFDGKYKEFGPIAIYNKNKDKKLVKIVNVIGQEVDNDYPGLKFFIFEK